MHDSAPRMNTQRCKKKVVALLMTSRDRNSWDISGSQRSEDLASKTNETLLHLLHYLFSSPSAYLSSRLILHGRVTVRVLLRVEELLLPKLGLLVHLNEGAAATAASQGKIHDKGAFETILLAEIGALES